MPGYALADGNAIAAFANHYGSSPSLHHNNFCTYGQPKSEQASNHVAATFNSDNFSPGADLELIELER